MDYSVEDSAVIAEHIIDAALCGYEYSGLPKLLDAIESKRNLRPRTPMKVIKETPVSIVFEGGNNIGMLAIQRLGEAVLAKALVSGFAIGGVQNSWMSGRGAHYVEKLVNHDLVVIHTVSSQSYVAPLGGIEAILGTNPITIGLPTANGPLIFDMGTSAIMYTDLTLRERRGEKLPEGVALDPLGNPTQDPTAARAGALLPFAGHKGFGLALMMHAMGLLTGAGSTADKNNGHLIIAFKPDLMYSTEQYKEDVSALITRIKTSKRAPGVDEIRIPSERSFKERARNLKEGLEFDTAVSNSSPSFKLRARSLKERSDGIRISSTPGARFEVLMRVIRALTSSLYCSAEYIRSGLNAMIRCPLFLSAVVPAPVSKPIACIINARPKPL
jgi:LDH2 family malate/lactate/ureidoglycolate dehydrogenase